MQILGKKIRTLRRQKEWNQDEVASRLGISIPAYSKIEAGITDVNLSRLEQIAAVFQIPVTAFFTDDEAIKIDNENELDKLTQLLHDREQDIISLQKKVIELYGALKS